LSIKKSTAEEVLAFQLSDYKIPFQRELKLVPDRKFRWDFVVLTLAVEIQGGTWISGGHTTGKGYQRDCEKMQLVILEGYTPVFFTTQDVLEGRAIQMIRNIYVTPQILRNSRTETSGRDDRSGDDKEGGERTNRHI